MLNAAARIVSLGRPVAEEQPVSSIFGSAAGLAQSIERDERFRISVYPINCSSMPDAAMGVASCLSYLLEQFNDIRVYRCFARIDADDESDEITSDDYQFSPSDWELEGLDDNIILSGSLTGENSGFRLTLSLDMSLVSGAKDLQFSYVAKTLVTLINLLPKAATDLAESISQVRFSQQIVTFAPLTEDSSGLADLLETVFGWNLDLYLFFWDAEWKADDIQAQYLEFAELCNQHANSFAYWCLGMMSQQVMQIGMEDISDVILPLLDRVIVVDSHQKFGAAAMSLGLGRLGYTDRAIALLQPFLDDRADAICWTRMIDLQLESGRPLEAIDTCQQAIESGLEHPAFYQRYIELLQLSEANDWLVEEVLLIDPDEIDEAEQIPCEIVSASKAILRLEPKNMEMLQLALSYMIDVEDGELWEYFDLLVKQDSAGIYLSDVIERLAELNDLGPAYDILTAQLESKRRQAAVYACLAQLALVDEDVELAQEYIEKARQTEDEIDDDLELELQRLDLVARLPGFEAHFAEIKVMLNAKRPLGAKEVDLLEDAIELAPSMIDLYVTLARCYLSWHDSESANEVLNDAQQRAGEHPRIILLIVQNLWNGSQRDDAVQKLNQGIETYPNDIALLAQMASYLVENRQLTDARQYIERAESIAPSNAAVMQVRRLIAEKLAE